MSATRYGVLGRGRAGGAIAPIVAEEAALAWWWSLGDDGAPSALPAVDVVILAVPDGAIEAAARSLVDRPGADGEIWLHLSGSRPGRVARVDPRVPAHVGCMHPLVALTGVPDRAHLAGATAGIDGEAGALAAAEALGRALGLIPRRLEGDAKPLYHAAAVTVAGHAVALFAQACAMLERAGFSAGAARAALQPLMRGAVDNLAERAPAEAITGPLTRGDVATIEGHIAQLDGADDPTLAATYRQLATTALGLSADALPPRTRARLAATLHA